MKTKQQIKRSLSQVKSSLYASKRKNNKIKAEVFTFGKYKRKKISKTPLSYLVWFAKEKPKGLYSSRVLSSVRRCLKKKLSLNEKGLMHYLKRA